MKTDKTVGISRIKRGVIETKDLFIACKICFAFIIHAIHVEMYKWVGGALGVGHIYFLEQILSPYQHRYVGVTYSWIELLSQLSVYILFS